MPINVRAFDRGQRPTIAFIDRATEPMGVTMPKLVTVLRKFLRDCFVPVWHTEATLVTATDFVPGAWAMLFVDDADVADALGYHDLTPDGLPLSKVFVRTTKEGGEAVSVTTCHELCEMLVDPAINLCSTGPRNLLYAYETSDAVESETFDIDGVTMSDFVYPSWFEGFRKPNSTQFDFLSRVHRPFEILPGGYMPVMRKGKWTQIFGSASKRARFAREDRRDHRSTFRGRTARMRPSEDNQSRALLGAGARELASVLPELLDRRRSLRRAALPAPAVRVRTARE